MNCLIRRIVRFRFIFFFSNPVLIGSELFLKMSLMLPNNDGTNKKMSHIKLMPKIWNCIEWELRDIKRTTFAVQLEKMTISPIRWAVHHSHTSLNVRLCGKHEHFSYDSKMCWALICAQVIFKYFDDVDLSSLPFNY